MKYNNVKEVRKAIESKKVRGAWMNGVKAYALELINELECTMYYDECAMDNENLLHKALLNGASDWMQYSEGGCSLITDRSIAERLCNATELKRCHDGQLNPNSRENWIQCQARALFQAERMIMEVMRND